MKRLRDWWLAKDLLPPHYIFWRVGTSPLLAVAFVALFLATLINQGSLWKAKAAVHGAIYG